MAALEKKIGGLSPLSSFFVWSLAEDMSSSECFASVGRCDETTWLIHPQPNIAHSSHPVLYLRPSPVRRLRSAALLAFLAPNSVVPQVLAHLVFGAGWGELGKWAMFPKIEAGRGAKRWREFAIWSDAVAVCTMAV
eukprot:scaffold5905_cov132-Isochrysis_galbana.AAC.7